MGGLTPCQELVDTVLTPVEGEVRRILDIGVYSVANLLPFYSTLFLTKAVAQAFGKLWRTHIHRLLT